VKPSPLAWLVLIIAAIVAFCRFIIPLTVCVAFPLVLLGLDAEPAVDIGCVVAAFLIIYSIYLGLWD